DEAMEDDEEDDAEVINPYEEADPHNRPPPTFDEETEYAPPVVQVADVDNIPIPPVIQFGNFHVRESSALRDLLEGNDEVCVPGPMPCDLRSVHRGVKRLIRANRSESSKMMRLITDLSREFSKLKSQNRKAKELSRWEAWVRGEFPTAYDSRRSLPSIVLLYHFHGTEGAVGLVRWFEKMENTFEISKCAEVRKVKFATATLHDRALTWWNSQVATLGREALMKVASTTTVTFRSNSGLVCPRILSSGQCSCIVLPSVVVLVLVVVVSVVSSAVVVVVVVVALIIVLLLFLETFSYPLILRLNFLFHQGVGHTHGLIESNWSG
nr:putative reverse transcriptase domain-containing protein [Tanacetum cinerariifolium]